MQKTHQKAAPQSPVPSKGKQLAEPVAKQVPTAKKGIGKNVAPVVHTQKRGGQSERAGLQFGVARVSRFMKQGRYADRIGAGAPVYLAATLQYIVSELIELASNEALNQKKQRINPRHVMLAIRNDAELNKLIGSTGDFAHAGVVPNIPKALLPSGKKGGKKCADDEDMAE